MRIMFLDESDVDPNKPNINIRFFLMTGLIVDSNLIVDLDNELQNLKEKFQLDNFKELRENKLNNSEKNLLVNNEVSNLLEKYGCKVISALIGSKYLKTLKMTPDDSNGYLYLKYSQTYDFIIERFLLNLRNWKEKGLIIVDKLASGKIEKPLQKDFFDRVLKGNLEMYGKFLGRYSEYILKSLLFLDDKYSNILQATDLICYAFRNRWYDLERGKIKDFWTNENKEDLLKVYWKLLVSSPQGKINGYGLKIWY